MLLELGTIKKKKTQSLAVYAFKLSMVIRQQHIQPKASEQNKKNP